MACVPRWAIGLTENSERFAISGLGQGSENQVGCGWQRKRQVLGHLEGKVELQNRSTETRATFNWARVTSLKFQAIIFVLLLLEQLLLLCSQTSACICSNGSFLL